MLIRKRHDLPSRVLTSKKTGSSNCIHESGNILTNQVSRPISNLNSNLNSSKSTGSSFSPSGSSNVRELDIKSRNVAGDLNALQNGGSGKYKMTHDVDGEEKEINDDDNNDNNNDGHNDNNNKNHDISFIQNNIRSQILFEVKELKDANHNKIKKKNIPVVQSVPSDSSDSSDGEM